MIQQLTVRCRCAAFFEDKFGGYTYAVFPSWVYWQRNVLHVRSIRPSRGLLRCYGGLSTVMALAGVHPQLQFGSNLNYYCCSIILVLTAVIYVVLLE